MSEISRRTLLTGAAWSIPVLATAIALPAAAASDTCPTRGTEYAFYATGPNDVANIRVVVGDVVVVTFVKDYPNATALNIDGKIVWKSPDSGVLAGKIVSFDLADVGICDPTFIQVDGNNTHYFGGGIFR